MNVNNVFFCGRIVASSIFESILARRILRNQVVVVKEMFFSDAFDQSHAFNSSVQFFAS